MLDKASGFQISTGVLQSWEARLQPFHRGWLGAGGWEGCCQARSEVWQLSTSKPSKRSSSGELGPVNREGDETRP